MKKGFKSLLSLILVFVSALVIVGCKKTTVVDDTNEVLSNAASYVFGLYKDTVGTKTDSFEVLNAVKIGDKKVTLTWALSVTDENGTAIENSEAVTLTKKNEAESTVYVGFYDGKVTQKLLFTLAPSLTYKETTKTLVELEGEDGATKGVFKYSVDPMILGNRTGWDALASDKTTSINIKGVVLGVLQDGSSKGSFYFQDEEGYGYYAYNPTNAVTSAGKFNVKAGDVVIVSGKRSDYNGQQEFAKGCTFKVLAGQEMTPVVADGTADWKAAKDNTAVDAKYQNTLVELKECHPVAAVSNEKKDDGTYKEIYFYFTIGDKTAQFNVYDSYYFLTDEQRAAFRTAWNDAFANGATISIKGIATVYSKAIQIYGAPGYPEIITVTGAMTDAEKAQSTIAELETAIPAYLAESKEITLPTQGRFQNAQVTWAIKSATAQDKVAIANGKLNVTKDASLTSFVVTLTVVVGAETKTKDITVTMVNETITVAQFLTAADKTNVQYVKGIVGAVRCSATVAGSFVLVDASGSAIFSYEKVVGVAVGDEIIVAAKFAENGDYKFPQLGTVKNVGLVQIVSHENTVPGLANPTEFTSNDAKDAKADAATVALWAGKALVVEGYLAKDGTYINLYTGYEENKGTGKFVSLYGVDGANYDSWVGKYVQIVGYCRGVANGNISVQITTIKEVKAPKTVAPAAVEVDATQPLVLKAAEGNLTVAENKIAKSETVNIVFYSDEACTTPANLAGQYVQIEGIAVKTVDSTIAFYVTSATPVFTPAHAGTEADPYSVADVIGLAAMLPAYTAETESTWIEGYIKGYVVTNGTEGSYVSNIDLADAADSTTKFHVYSFNTTSELKNVGKGDLIVIKGFIKASEIGGVKKPGASSNTQCAISAIVSRGTGSVAVATTSSDKATVTLPAVTTGENGSEFTFTVAVEDGFDIAAVKVNGNAVTATAGVYKAVFRGETLVEVTTASAAPLALPIDQSFVGTAQNDTTLPAGWSGTVGGNYASPFWQSFRNNNQYIVSAKFEEQTSVKVTFHYYLNNFASGDNKTSKIKIEALNAAGEVVGTAFTSDNLNVAGTGVSNAHDVVATLTGTGIVKIRITFLKSSGGNIAFGNIKIEVPAE